MDIIDYLYGFGSELQGLNSSPEDRAIVLRYIEARLEEVLQKVKWEKANGNHDDRE